MQDLKGIHKILGESIEYYAEWEKKKAIPKVILHNSI